MKYTVYTSRGKLLIETDFLDVARRVMEANRNSHIKYNKEAIAEVNAKLAAGEDTITAEPTSFSLPFSVDFIEDKNQFTSVAVMDSRRKRVILQCPDIYGKTFARVIIGVLMGTGDEFIDDFVDQIDSKLVGA